MKLWKRGRGEKLSPHFHTREFECLCSLCADQRIDMRLIERLEEVRVELGIPLIITAGFRCARKQQMLREAGYETSVGPSSHEAGQAADISCTDIDALVAACEKRFDAIGVGRSFVHVDLRSGKKRRWSYVRA